MDDIDQEIEIVVSQLRQSGAVVGVDTNAPLYVKRAFLDMISKCPDCREALKKSNSKGE